VTPSASSSSGSARAAITAPTSRSAVASGTTSQCDAGGSNGFGTTQPAGSLKTSGWPPAIASCHAAGSKPISSRALRAPSRGDASKRVSSGRSAASGR
jgi:hypothetical protein